MLLTRQFRFPAYVNGHPDGMLIETAAGLLDDDDPETAIRREAAEETGVDDRRAEHVFDAYMSPGSVTERLHFFAAPYTPADRTGAGGGVADEGEDIEVVELPFDEALAMIADGRDRRRQDHHAAAVGRPGRPVLLIDVRNGCRRAAMRALRSPATPASSTPVHIHTGVLPQATALNRSSTLMAVPRTVSGMIRLPASAPASSTRWITCVVEMALVRGTNTNTPAATAGP